MLIQVSTPRPLFDHAKYPEYLHIHTLRKAGVSKGEVFFMATVDPEHGTKDSKALDPVNEYLIEGVEGFLALEYVLPFWAFFQRTDTMKKAKYLGESAESQGIQVGSVGMARFFTNGFQITAKSAFRADRTTYQEHVVAFTIMCPSSGGGILRLANCPYDIANPTFNPWAVNPHPPKNLELQDAFNRTHKLGNSGIEARRAARIAEAEANIKRNEELSRKALPEGRKALPEGRKALPAPSDPPPPEDMSLDGDD